MPGEGINICDDGGIGEGVMLFGGAELSQRRLGRRKIRDWD
jgi:hypothetical protein